VLSLGETLLHAHLESRALLLDLGVADRELV
jgi:hypothetical protein